MLRIGIIGPESSGKSTLARQLADALGAFYVDEYAREYVEKLDRDYTYNDVVAIAKKQIEQLDADYPSPIVLFDTELIITKVWFEHKYGTCPEFVDDYLSEHPLDFYLLCAPDLPFEPDPVRENPHIREELFARYLELVKQSAVPYSIITGTGEQRVRNAIKGIELREVERS